MDHLFSLLAGQLIRSQALYRQTARGSLAKSERKVRRRERREPGASWHEKSRAGAEQRACEKEGWFSQSMHKRARRLRWMR